MAIECEHRPSYEKAKPSSLSSRELVDDSRCTFGSGERESEMPSKSPIATERGQQISAAPEFLYSAAAQIPSTSSYFLNQCGCYQAFPESLHNGTEELTVGP
ncbi:unnamed protein product [Natator depressus]